MTREHTASDLEQEWVSIPPVYGSSAMTSQPVVPVSNIQNVPQAITTAPTTPPSVSEEHATQPTSDTQLAQQASGTQTAQSTEVAIQPLIDVFETPKKIVVLDELPGYTDDDIVIEGINQQIKIAAERDEEFPDDGQLHLRERLLRAERTVALPSPVDFEDADASFEHGVCRIEIPKVEETRTHRIGIH